VSFNFAIARNDISIVYGFGGYNCHTKPPVEIRRQPAQSNASLDASQYVVYKGLEKRSRERYEYRQGPALLPTRPTKRQATEENHVGRLFGPDFRKEPTTRKRVQRDEEEWQCEEECHRRIKKPATRRNNVKSYSTFMHRVPQEIRDIIYGHVVREPEGLYYAMCAKARFNNSNGEKRTTVLEEVSGTMWKDSRNVYLKTNEVSFPTVTACIHAMTKMPEDQKASLRHIKVQCQWRESPWNEFLAGVPNKVREDINYLVALLEDLPGLKRVRLVVDSWSWASKRQFYVSPTVAQTLQNMRDRGELPDKKKLVILPAISADCGIPYMCWGNNPEMVDEEYEKYMFVLAKKWLRNEL